MTDVLIRNVDPSTLARIDARAEVLGLTRGEYLRRSIDQDAARTDSTVTMAHLEAFSAASRGLLDDELMARAWS